MSNATAVSDIEREEHDKTFGVKKTRMYGYDGSNLVGVKTNAAGNILVADNYDTVEVDTTNDPVFTITRKMGATIVDVKTITIT